MADMLQYNLELMRLKLSELKKSRDSFIPPAKPDKVGEGSFVDEVDNTADSVTTLLATMLTLTNDTIDIFTKLTDDIETREKNASQLLMGGKSR